MRWAALLVVLCGCSEKTAVPLSSLKPAPLPSAASSGLDGGLDPASEAQFRVRDVQIFGEAAPAEATVVELGDDAMTVGARSAPYEKASELLKGVGAKVALRLRSNDVYLAQVLPLLRALDDGKTAVWLVHPNGVAAYALTLRDEPSFQKWLEEPVPGKVRIIQRQDGLEVSTNIGKVPGADPNGPSLPVRGGSLDIAALRETLERVQTRFHHAKDICVMPSLGTELSKVAEVLSGTFRAADDGIFDERCLVYPRR